MSYYYSYFIGACNKNTGMFRVLGPFAKDEKNGKMRLAPVICKSQSFASDLHEEFSPISEAKMCPEMIEQFTYNHPARKPLTLVMGSTSRLAKALSEKFWRMRNTSKKH